MLNRRQFGVASLLALPGVARAQTAWPAERAIEIIAPYPPGGGVDLVARLVAQHLPSHLPGARCVVTNRPGAGGQLGFEYAFNAAPDGYTLGAVTLPAISTFALERHVRYRPLDFTFLANIVDDPNTIYVAADSPLQTLADLLKQARAEPGALSYGTTGNGSDDHILMLNLEAAAGLPAMTHVPFAGAAPLLTQVLGHHLELGVGNMSEILPTLREGSVRSLGAAAPTRWDAAPSVPTFREQGVDVLGGSARGIVAPPRLPTLVRSSLQDAMRAMLVDASFARDATAAALPMRLLLGDAYRDVAAQSNRDLRALWQRRPWTQ